MPRLLAFVAIALALAGCPVDLDHWRQGAACGSGGCPPGQECADNGLCLARCSSAGACAPDKWNEGASFSCQADGLCHFSCANAGDTCPTGTSCNEATSLCRGTTQPEILAADQDQPQSITVDATSVYWANTGGGAAGGGAVMKVALAGGTPVTLASGQDHPTDLAVDATSAYWINLYGDAVMRVPLDGGTPVALAAGLQSPQALALDATGVYFVAGQSMGQPEVLKVPLAGGTPAVLATLDRQPHQLAVDASHLYWEVLPTGAGGQGDVWRMPRAGGTSTLFTATPGIPLGFVLDDTTIYGLTMDETEQNCTLWKAALSGGTPTTLGSGANNWGDRHRPAVDGTHVYFGRTYSGMGGLGSVVVRVPIDGGPEVTVASQIENLGNCFAVDATHVYFSAAKYPYGNAIMRMSK